MRTRLLKPGFFTNEHLARLPLRARLLYAGLWCLADREGRLEDRPDRIAAAIFPYERVRIGPFLNCLIRAQFARRYTAVATRCIELPNFSKHQQPHRREAPSLLPPPTTRTGLGQAKDRTSRAVYGVRCTVLDQDQDLTGRDGARPAIPFKRYAAIGARAVDAPPQTSDLGELAERFKTLCAEQHLPYDAAITQKSLDAVLRARARRRA
jgi:hypothetical protein